MSMSSISGLSAPESEILRIGQLAARQAGDIMLAGSKEFNIDNLQQKAGDRDVLTEYDTRAQNKIKEIILNAFPSHQFLGEEDVAPGRDAAADAISKNVTASNLWIVDPIDGTTNFAHSMPLSGVIIAYAEAGIITLGIIYDPFHDEMFVAFKGKGAYCNNLPITVDKAKTISSSVLGTGSPPNIDSLNGCLRAQQVLSDKCRTIRILGAACLNVAWTANGRMSAYFETDMNVWDVAAGALLITEAGGKVTDIDGNPYTLSTRSFVSSNGLIHEELLKYLREADFRMP